MSPYPPDHKAVTLPSDPPDHKAVTLPSVECTWFSFTVTAAYILLLGHRYLTPQILYLHLNCRAITFLQVMG